MTWTLILLLAAGAYAFKFTGLVIIGARTLPPIFERCLALIPAAVISALINSSIWPIKISGRRCSVRLMR